MLPPIAHSPAYPKPRPTIERRLVQRSSPGALLALLLGVDGRATAVQVHNLSARGIALQSKWPVAPDTTLHVRLINPAATFSLVVTVRVVRCDPALKGDHLLGCVMVRMLEPSELMPFLA